MRNTVEQAWPEGEANVDENGRKHCKLCGMEIHFSQRGHDMLCRP